MRVVGGRWRGRRLLEPAGSDVTRPTTDRVREAMASMIDAALPEGIAGARVLDAFGGSGALAIEMLSRGAAFALIYDADRGAAQLIRKNLAQMGAGSTEARVVCGDVLAQASRGRVLGGPFDLVLLDPPYAMGAAPVEELLGHLRERGALSPWALAVHEHAARDCGARPEGFEVLREKRYGICAVDLLRFEGEDDGQRTAPVAGEE